jgi:hypothetical protein
MYMTVQAHAASLLRCVEKKRRRAGKYTVVFVDGRRWRAHLTADMRFSLVPVSCFLCVSPIRRRAQRSVGALDSGSREVMCAWS